MVVRMRPGVWTDWVLALVLVPAPVVRLAQVQPPLPPLPARHWQRERRRWPPHSVVRLAAEAVLLPMRGRGWSSCSRLASASCC